MFVILIILSTRLDDGGPRRAAQTQFSVEHRSAFYASRRLEGAKPSPFISYFVAPALAKLLKDENSGYNSETFLVISLTWLCLRSTQAE